MRGEEWGCLVFTCNLNVFIYFSISLYLQLVIDSKYTWEYRVERKTLFPIFSNNPIPFPHVPLYFSK